MVEVRTLALAVSKATAVAKCSCTSAGAPRGRGASAHAVARMPTRCKPRVSAQASTMVDSGWESQACSCCSHNLHLGAYGSLTGMYGENSIVHISAQLSGWWHVGRSKLGASEKRKLEEGGGKRIPLDEPSMSCIERLRGSCKPWRAWRCDVPGKKTGVLQTIMVECVSQKGAVTLGKAFSRST
eukprot:5524118-Amphidinium_carterae.1